MGEHFFLFIFFLNHQQKHNSYCFQFIFYMLKSHTVMIQAGYFKNVRGDRNIFKYSLFQLDRQRSLTYLIKICAWNKRCEIHRI